MPARHLQLVDDDAMTRLARAALTMRPEQLRRFAAGLSPEDLAVLEQAVGDGLAIGWRATPATLAAYLDPGYQLWRYVRLLGELFAASADGRGTRRIVNLPSQYGKTSFLTWAIIWLLDRDPSRRIMYVSYDANRAVEVGGRARDIAQRHADSLRFELRPDLRARGEWQTPEGGGLYCTGIGGAITGFPADDLLLDDLMKGWQAAHSETQRNEVWRVYQSQLRLRIQGERSIIWVAGTRWHEDDHFAKLRAASSSDVEADQWESTVLPAQALDENDPLGRDLGEPLEPDRFSLVEVRARRAALGSYLAGALEDQNPTPEEGGELPRAWWRFEDSPPSGCDVWISSWDTKMKDKEAGDYVVGQVWGRAGTSFHCVDQMRGQWSQAITRVAIALTQHRHPQISRHYVEAAGWGPELRAQMMEPDPGYELRPEIAGQLGIVGDEFAAVQRSIRRGLSNVVGNPPKGDKRARLRAHSGTLEAGRVFLLSSVPSLAVLVDEAAAFPNGTHDDTLDAFSQAMLKLSRGTATIRSAAGGRRPAARATRTPSPR